MNKRINVRNFGASSEVGYGRNKIQQNNTNDTTNHLSSSAPTGPCTLCKTPTFLLCNRCGDNYCSVTCQERDWPKHRYICFEMPPLVHTSLRNVEGMPKLNGYQAFKQHQDPISPRPNVDGSGSQHKKWNNPERASTPEKELPTYNEKTQANQPKTNSRRSASNDRERTPNKPVESNNSNNNANNPNTSCKQERVPFPANNSIVRITAAVSSNRVFVRSNEREDNDKYCEIVKVIHEHGKQAQTFTKMPTKYSFAISKFEDDDEEIFYRVQIIAPHNENEIDVMYCDFGNKATRKLSDLRTITPELIRLAVFPTAISMRGVPFMRDNEKVTNFVKLFEDTDARIIYTEKPFCELKLLNADESLNKKINLFIKNEKNEDANKQLPSTSMQQSKPNEDDKAMAKTQPKTQHKQKQPNVSKEDDKPKTTSFNSLPELKLPSSRAPSVVSQKANAKSRPSQLWKPVMIPPFEMLTLPLNGKNLDIIVVDNSLMSFGYFSCILSKDKENLQSIQKYLSDREDDTRPYKPRVGEYCLANYEDFWYRAKVLNIISQEEVEVVYIDFLNESQVPISRVRRYPLDFNLPCKTTLCMIYDLPADLTPKIQEYLADKLQPGSEHKISQVHDLEEDESIVAVVKMNQVSQWLSIFK